jgi:hypothetical protein
MQTDKPRIAIVQPHEIAIMRTQDDLAHPYVEIQTDGTGRADADELKAWRASQHTSGVSNE